MAVAVRPLCTLSIQYPLLPIVLKCTPCRPGQPSTAQSTGMPHATCHVPRLTAVPGRTIVNARPTLQGLAACPGIHSSCQCGNDKQSATSHRRTAERLLSTTATRGQNCRGERETRGCQPAISVSGVESQPPDRAPCKTNGPAAAAGRRHARHILRHLTPGLKCVLVPHHNQTSLL